MKQFLILSGLVIILCLSIYWVNREPKPLYSARLYVHGGGLTTQAGLILRDNQTYRMWRSGCFHGFDSEGEYITSHDTLFLDNLESLKNEFETFDLAKDSLLEFNSCDTLIQEKFSFLIADKNSH